MTDSVCVIGRIEITHKCVDALLEQGVKVGLLIGWGGPLKGVSGGTGMAVFARKRKLRMLLTQDINYYATQDAIRRSGCALSVVTGWSQLLKADTLAIPKLGTVGLHPTKLPEGRGRAPIPWTILKKLKTSAVTLFHLTPGADDGDIIAQIPLPLIYNNANGGELIGYNAELLYDDVCQASVRLVAEYVPKVLNGTAPRTPQDNSKATYWPARRPEDGKIDWTKSGEAISLLVDAVTRPYPGAYGTLPGMVKVKVWRAFPDRLPMIPHDPMPPGTVERITELGQAVVACGKDGLDRVHLAEVRLPGGNRRRLKVGDRLR